MLTRDELRNKLEAAYVNVGLPIEGDWHAFYTDVMPTYKDVLAELGQVGFWVHAQLGGDDDWIDGLEIAMPNGAVLAVPDPLAVADTEFNAIDAVVNFFLRLPRFLVTEITPLAGDGATGHLQHLGLETSPQAPPSAKQKRSTR